MIMTQEEINAMHEVQLELLKEVDRICKKNNIKYCIIAGTLLGAVRHDGFIPWDYDADVALLRPEYDRFVDACLKDLDTENFYFQDHKLTPGFRWGYGKLKKQNTIWQKEGREEILYKNGVTIDIFPLDHAPNNLFLRKIHDIGCTVVRKLGWSKTGKEIDKNTFMRLVYGIMDLVPEKQVHNIMDKWIEFSNRKDTEIVRILTFPTPNNGFYGYYKRWYEELEDMSFEGYDFPAIKDYDEYLTFKFGDYMIPPPKELCVINNCAYFSLEHDTMPK